MNKTRRPGGVCLMVLTAVVLVALPGVPATADHPPPPETHEPAGSGQLQGAELVEEQAGFPCFRATRTLMGLRGTGTFEGQTPEGAAVVYSAQIDTGQTLYGNGPLQVQLENNGVYYHGPFGTHGTEAGGGAGCSPSTAGTPVPAEFRIFAAEGTQDADGDTDVDLLAGAAWVYRLNATGDKVPCVGVGSFARKGGDWRAEWTLSADCVVAGDAAATSGTGTAPRGTFMTHHGGHAPCFEPPCVDNLQVDYQQHLPIPGPYLRLTGPATATVGCDQAAALTARLTDTGWPAAGVPVSFSVAGPGPAVPPSGEATTDANGAAAFSFTAAVAGDYTVTATATLNGELVSATHTVRFNEPPPLSLALASQPNRWQTEEQVTVTATATNACGPLPGALVDFTVVWPPQDKPWTGQATPDSGSALSDADGRASFSFSGDRAGDYRIDASTRLLTGEEASDSYTVSLEVRNFKGAGAIELPKGERQLATAVVDPAGDFAYFGGAAGRVVKVDLGTFQRVGAITLQNPDGVRASWVRAAVIDPAGRFAYFAGDPFGDSDVVIRVDLETFTQTAAIHLAADEVPIESAVIDPAGDYAYFGTAGYEDGKIVKVDLATFTRVGAIDTQIGDQELGEPFASVMDPAGRYAYFATTDWFATGRVLKVDLATFQIADVMALASPEEYEPVSAVIDPAGGFAYFAARGDRIVKVDLTSFQRVGAITLSSGHYINDGPGVMDPAGDFAYFGTYAGEDVSGAMLPAGVVKIDLRTFERAHHITPQPDSGVNNFASAVIDRAGNYAYFGTSNYQQSDVQRERPPDRVVKVMLNRPPDPALVAGDDAYPASAGTPLTVAAPGVLGNDDDTTTSDDRLAAGQATDPAGGSVALNPDGSFTYTPDPGFAGTDTFTYTATNGMDYSAPATVTMAVAPAAGVTGRAFGYHAYDISLFGGPQEPTGPTPAVALASDGSNSPQSTTAPSGLVQYGPAVLFTSDRIDLSSAVGPGGDTVTTSSAIANINRSTSQPTLTGGEIFTADSLSATATAGQGGTSGSTTVTNGTYDVHSNHFNCSSPTATCGGHTHDGENPAGTTLVPANPPANYTVAGHLHLDDTTTDHFVIVFNEQIDNPDGSITLNPVHEHFGARLDANNNIVDDPNGILQGELIVGQAVAGTAAPTPSEPGVVADFDGDADTDVSVFRPTTGAWFVQGRPTTYHGRDGDAAVPADYDGDGDADVAVFRPANGGWFVQGSLAVYHGRTGDIPVPADYDGDGDAEPAVFRPASGGWYVAGQPAVFFGRDGDIPVPGHYDADPEVDLAVFRPTTGAWFVQGSPTTYHGRNGDVPVPGDYDGDGDTDLAVFRPATGGWYVAGQAAVFFGRNGDVPVPGQYAGGAAAEIAVFRPANGGWYRPGQATVFFGRSGDAPLPLPHAIRQAFF